MEQKDKIWPDLERAHLYGALSLVRDMIIS